MRILKFDKDKFLDINVVMIASNSYLKHNTKLLLLAEILRYLEPEGCICRSETRNKIRIKLKFTLNHMRVLLHRLQKEDHIQLKGDIIYPHPKYIAIARSQGSLLITTK